MLSPPRRPDSTRRIFSAAENWRRVARRISLITCSAGSFTGSHCWPIFAPLLATMGHQPSLSQPTPSVPQALTPDSPPIYRESRRGALADPAQILTVYEGMSEGRALAGCAAVGDRYLTSG